MVVGMSCGMMPSRMAIPPAPDTPGAQDGPARDPPVKALRAPDCLETGLVDEIDARLRDAIGV
jgi:hypothetical protein